MIESPSSTEVSRVLDSLEVDPEGGLSPGEARRRVDRHGPNVIEQRDDSGLLQLLSTSSRA